ncbi:MAG: hypothetical protein ACJ8FS_01640 [Sphingomicrobium sp.]
MNRQQAELPRKVGPLSSDACGCVMSARFMATALLGSGIYYGWRWLSGDASLTHTGLIILGWAFGAALVGKLFGMAAHRQRTRMPRHLQSILRGGR